MTESSPKSSWTLFFGLTKLTEDEQTRRRRIIRAVVLADGAVFLLLALVSGSYLPIVLVAFAAQLLVFGVLYFIAIRKAIKREDLPNHLRS